MTARRGPGDGLNADGYVCPRISLYHDAASWPGVVEPNATSAAPTECKRAVLRHASTVLCLRKGPEIGACSTWELELAERFEFDGFTLVYLRHPSSPFELELTVNKDRGEPYALGDGYGHLAVVVDDVEAEHARFGREGLEAGAVRDFKHEGRTPARFFFATDPDDYKIEIIDKGGRFGWDDHRRCQGLPA